jgi:hypothetical protein
MYRSQLPNTADDDDVHMESVISAEVGHQQGAHSIHEYFFSLRTVRSTGVQRHCQIHSATFQVDNHLQDGVCYYGESARVVT